MSQPTLPAGDDTPNNNAPHSADDSFIVAKKREQLFGDFEDAWKSATQPSIETVLGPVPETDRETVLRELLGIELDQRLRRGEVPQLAAYRSRFPDHVPLVDATYCQAMKKPNVARFRSIDRLGIGGQGEVWLMLDPQIDRRVALKILKPTEKGSQHSLTLFRREAEVSGKLEHPNIVPVYDVTAELNESGQADPNSPCYVMRVFGDPRLHVATAAFHDRPRSAEEQPLLAALRAFDKEQSPEHRRELEGQLAKFSFDPQQACDQTLKTAVESILDPKEDSEAGTLARAITKLHGGEWSEPALKDLLDRFQRICDGVAYAHSRGVIHRDLKPENVMLGEYGETLVVDWGLAKLVGRDEEHQAANLEGALRVASEGADPHQSQHGDVMGTLAYMSPEQALGHIGELGPATDIYSLGAILYSVLTGQSAFKGTSTEEVLARVLKGEFPRPTKIEPRVPKPLEAIVLKAMSLKPPGRYAKARDLADDVKRWLNDEPVSAWPEPFTVRANRWVKNHKTAVTSTAASVLAASICLSVLFVMVSSRNQSLAYANRDLDTANQSLIAKNAEITESNHRERDAAEEARMHSLLASELAHEVIFEFDPFLKNMTGAAEVRQTVLQRVTPLIRKISTRYTSPGKRERTELHAMLRIVDLMTELGSSEVGEAAGLIDSTSNVLKDAEAVSRQAVDAARKLLESAPDSFHARHDQQVARNKLADLLYHMGQFDESERLFVQTLQEVESRDERMAREEPDSQRDLPFVLQRLGLVCQRTGRAADALRYYTRERDVLVPLATGLAVTDTLQRDLLVAHLDVGNLQLRQGPLKEAEQSFQSALGIAEQRASALPANRQAQRDLVVALMGRSDLLTAGNKLKDADSDLKRAIVMLDSLVNQNPLDFELNRTLATVLGSQADLYFRLVQLTEAETSARRALALRENLTAKSPGHQVLRAELVTSWNSLGQILSQQKKLPEAQQLLERGVTEGERLFVEAKGLRNADLSRSISIACNELGKLHSAENKNSESLKWFKKSLTFSEQAAKEHPEDRRAQRDFCISLSRLGDIHQQSGDLEISRDLFRRAHTGYLRLAEESPRDLSAQFDIIAIGDRLARSEALVGNLTAARAAFADALRANANIRKVVDSPQLKLNEAKLRRAAGLLSLMIPDLKDARTAFESSAQLFKELQERKQLSPRDAELLKKLEDELQDVAQRELALGDLAEIESRPQDELLKLLTIRSVESARMGRLEDAEEAIRKVEESKPQDFETLFDLVRAHGMLAVRLADKSVIKTDPALEEQRRQQVEHAVRILRQAVDVGFNNLSLLKLDRDLHELRSHPDFQAVIKQLEAQANPKP